MYDFHYKNFKQHTKAQEVVLKTYYKKLHEYFKQLRQSLFRMQNVNSKSHPISS